MQGTVTEAEVRATKTILSTLIGRKGAFKTILFVYWFILKILGCNRIIWRAYLKVACRVMCCGINDHHNQITAIDYKQSTV